MRNRLYLFVAAACVGVLATVPTRAQETLKVAVPQRGAWDTAVPELGQRGGIFKKHGLSLEILYTQGGPESIQAVVSGSMDIGTGVGVSAALGAFSKGAPIRLIGSEMIGSPDLYWYVPAASAIRKTEDLAVARPVAIRRPAPPVTPPCSSCSNNTNSTTSRLRSAVCRRRSPRP